MRRDLENIKRTLEREIADIKRQMERERNQ